VTSGSLVLACNGTIPDGSRYHASGKPDLGNGGEKEKLKGNQAAREKGGAV